VALALGSGSPISLSFTISASSLLVAIAVPLKPRTLGHRRTAAHKVLLTLPGTPSRSLAAGRFPASRCHDPVLLLRVCCNLSGRHPPHPRFT